MRRPTPFELCGSLAAVVLIVLCFQQLSRQRTRTVAVTGAAPQEFIATLPVAGGRLCQQAVSLPEAVSRLIVTVGTFVDRAGPSIEVTARADRRDPFERIGGLRAGWRQGVVEIPLERHQTAEAAEICIRFAPGSRIAVAGERSLEPVRSGQRVKGRLSIVGVDDGSESFLSSFGELADVLPRGGPAVFGTWTAYLIAVLFVFAVGLAAVALRRTQRFAESDDRPPGRLGVPAAGWSIAACALTIGCAWALLIPPFQVADETSHFGYVQYLAENGGLPRDSASVPPYAEEERAVLDVLGFARIIGRPNERVISTPGGERDLRAAERAEYRRTNGGNASTASANPPLYYTLAAPVFLATGWSGLTGQLLAVRLLSVLLTALSVLLAFLFARELFSGSPWCWTAAGMACALLPLLGFAGAGVNADSLLFAASSSTLLAVARILRTGLTRGRAVWLGFSIAAGLLTKPLFVAFVPVALLALLLARRQGSRWSLRTVGLSLGSAAVPTVLIAGTAAIFFAHPYFQVAASVATQAADGGEAGGGRSYAETASYILQLFLPRLPFLTDLIPGTPIRDIWIPGIVGIFGWIDYGFGEQARSFGVYFFEALLALSVIAIARYRRAVLMRWRLVLACLGALALVLGAVGLVDYQSQRSGGLRFEQARYLLPLLPLYGGLFALAVKGVGERFGRYAVLALWVLVSYHTLGAMMLTVRRYYV